MPRKKKNVPPPQPELILTYKEFRTGGEVKYPDQYYSSREDEEIEFSIEDVYIDEPGRKAREKIKTWYTESLEYDFPIKPGDCIWIVVIRYSTGGTFVHTNGAWRIEGVYKTAEEATAVEKMIWEDEGVYRKKKEMPEEKYKKYKFWRGYFEGLENIEVKGFIVR